jgi:hypothetical protein
LGGGEGGGAHGRHTTEKGYARALPRVNLSQFQVISLGIQAGSAGP